MEPLDNTKKMKPLLAQNIVRLRKELGWRSALKFSEKAGIPYPTLRDIEAGVSSGTTETLGAIARALGRTVDDLYQRAQETALPSVSSELTAQIIEELCQFPIACLLPCLSCEEI